jgi:hypothetical protein
MVVIEVYEEQNRETFALPAQKRVLRSLMAILRLTILSLAHIIWSVHAGGQGQVHQPAANWAIYLHVLTYFWMRCGQAACKRYLAGKLDGFGKAIGDI